MLIYLELKRQTHSYTPVFPRKPYSIPDQNRQYLNYRKIPKISALYFSEAYFEGLIFGGAYLGRKICVSKSNSLALWLEENLLFFPCFTLYLRAISKYKIPGGLYLEGLIFVILRYIHKANITEYHWDVKFIFIPARKGIRAFHYSIEPVSATIGECPSRILY